MTDLQVKHMKPPIVAPGATIKVVHNKMWLAKRKRHRTIGQGSFSRTYNGAAVTPETATDVVRAAQREKLLKCVRWTWYVYHEEGGTKECPYNIGELQDDEMV